MVEKDIASPARVPLVLWYWCWELCTRTQKVYTSLTVTLDFHTLLEGGWGSFGTLIGNCQKGVLGKGGKLIKGKKMKGKRLKRRKEKNPNRKTSKLGKGKD